MHWAENVQYLKTKVMHLGLLLNKCDELGEKSFLNITKDVLVRTRLSSINKTQKWKS